MPGQRCMICGRGYGTGTSVHVFPNPIKFPERFKKWVYIVGGKLDTPSDYEFYKKKRICDMHFKDEHKTSCHRLSALAVPSINLPGSPDIQQSFQQIGDTQILAATLIPAPDHSGSPDIQQIGDTPILAATLIPAPDHSGSPDIQQIGDTPILAATLIPASDPSGPNPITGTSLLMEHNYSVLSRPELKHPVKGAFKDDEVKTRKMKIKRLQSEVCRLRIKSASLKQRLVEAQRLSSDAAFQYLTKDMKTPAKLFIQMQRQAKKKSKGRRFSIDEKILCLSLYKKSPKCYRMLSKCFTLPSSRAMTRLLAEIKIGEGINKIIFDKIKHGLRDQDVSQRLCTLIFDEMSITPQIFYNASSDSFSGFAYNQKLAFSDHALVFMVKGIKRQFKQPVAYYFTSGLKKMDLKMLIKTVTEEVMKTGLIVVATVCDQSAVNVGAITDLVDECKANYLRKGKEWQEDCFFIKGQKIIPLYDPPHLIKGIRNNLLNKNLTYVIDDKKKLVKWEYFQLIYEADKAQGELRLLNKISEEHINKEKINKMRVKSATQLFSHSVAVVTSHLTVRGELPEECGQLVDITLLLDNIFDSLNSSTLDVPNGKVFKGPVRCNSPHHQLWQKAIKILKTVKFIKDNNVQLTECIVPSVTNLIKTIEGMESLWKILNRKYRIDAVLTRNFNQDPVENFFGSIRSYGARNIAPNTVCFEGAFKALMVTNMNSPHSRRANCEEDSNDCLQNLDFYLKEKIVSAPEVPEDFQINFDKEVCLDQSSDDAGQTNYVCGWVIRKCFKNVIKTCENCRLNLLENNINRNNDYIRLKEYSNKKWLCYPSNVSENYFKAIHKLAVSVLKKDVSKKYIKQSIMLYNELLIDCPFKCAIHKDELQKYFLNVTLNVILYSWTRSVNRILAGKLTYVGDDEVKKLAQLYHNKFKHYKNRK